MKKLFISVILFLFLVVPLQAFEASGDAWTGNDYYTHTGTTADDVTFAWDGDLSTNQDFEVQIYNPERDITRHIDYTTNNEVTFKVPKTGHWIGKVRVRTQNPDTQEYSYGDWSESTNPDVALVDIETCTNDGCTTEQVNKAWWCFAWIKSTGPIITNSNSGLFFGIENNR